MEFTLAPTAGAQGVIASARDDQLRLMTIPKASAPVPVRDFGKDGRVGGCLAADGAGLLGGLLLHGAGFARDAESADRRDQCELGRHADLRLARPGGIARIYGDGESAMLKLFGDRSGRSDDVLFAPRWEGWWREKSGDAAGTEPWHAPDRLAWKPVPAISYWEGWKGAGLERFDGTIWFRKTVTLTAAQAKLVQPCSLGIFDEPRPELGQRKGSRQQLGWDQRRN